MRIQGFPLQGSVGRAPGCGGPHDAGPGRSQRKRRAPAYAGASTSGPVRRYCTAFAGASSPVAASSLGHVAGPHLPHCVLATDDDPRATPAQNPRTDPRSPVPPPGAPAAAAAPPRRARAPRRRAARRASRSPSTAKASATVTGGSNVDRIAASDGPTRRRPAKKADTAMTVLTSAISSSHSHASAGRAKSSEPVARPATVKLAVAPVSTSSASANGSIVADDPVRDEDVRRVGQRRGRARAARRARSNVPGAGREQHEHEPGRRHRERHADAQRRRSCGRAAAPRSSRTPGRCRAAARRATRRGARSRRSTGRTGGCSRPRRARGRSGRRAAADRGSGATRPSTAAGGEHERGEAEAHEQRAGVSAPASDASRPKMPSVAERRGRHETRPAPRMPA